MSAERYNSLKTQLPSADSPALAVSDLQRYRELYEQAQGLDLPGEALAVGLMPKSGQQLTDQALQSALSQLVSNLPTGDVTTLKDLLQIQKGIAVAAKGIPALESYAENLKLVLALNGANDRKIAAWADQAAIACAAATKPTQTN